MRAVCIMCGKMQISLYVTLKDITPKFYWEKVRWLYQNWKNCHHNIQNYQYIIDSRVQPNPKSGKFLKHKTPTHRTGSWKLVIEYYHMRIIDYMLEYTKYTFHSVTSLMSFKLFYIKPQFFQTFLETKMWTRWITRADRSQMFPNLIGWSFPMESVIAMTYFVCNKPRYSSRLISLRTGFFVLFCFLKHYWINWRLL